VADEDLKERVNEVLEEEDADAAVELLTAHNAYNIPKDKRNRLAALGLRVYIAPYYAKIVGLLTGEVVNRLSEDFGKYGKPETVIGVLEDPYYRKQHAAIISGAIENDKIRTAQFYASTINSVSDEMKETLNTALGRDVRVTNKELASILGDQKFAAHRKAIIGHVWARMSPDELEKLGEELRPLFSAEESAQWSNAVAHKRKHAAEDEEHESSSHDGDSSDAAWWILVIIAIVIILASMPP
jgi:hypothetical protein